MSGKLSLRSLKDRTLNSYENDKDILGIQWIKTFLNKKCNPKFTFLRKF